MFLSVWSLYKKTMSVLLRIILQCSGAFLTMIMISIDRSPFKLDILDPNHADVPHAQFDLELCNLNFDHNTNYLELAYMTW